MFSFVMYFNNSLSTHVFFFFFFNDTATTEIYTLSLHDALPISVGCRAGPALAHLVPVQPVAPQTGLALPGHLLLEAVGRCLVGRHDGDPGAPEPHVDTGGFPKGGGELVVPVPRAHREGDQHVVTGPDFGRQHPR